jgi:hypothetical protein
VLNSNDKSNDKVNIHSDEIINKKLMEISNNFQILKKKIQNLSNNIK